MADTDFRGIDFRFVGDKAAVTSSVYMHFNLPVKRGFEQSYLIMNDLFVRTDAGVAVQRTSRVTQCLNYRGKRQDVPIRRHGKLRSDAGTDDGGQCRDHARASAVDQGGAR